MRNYIRFFIKCWVASLVFRIVGSQFLQDSFGYHDPWDIFILLLISLFFATCTGPLLFLATIALAIFSNKEVTVFQFRIIFTLYCIAIWLLAFWIEEPNANIYTTTFKYPENLLQLIIGIISGWFFKLTIEGSDESGLEEDEILDVGI